MKTNKESIDACKLLEQILLEEIEKVKTPAQKEEDKKIIKRNMDIIKKVYQDNFKEEIIKKRFDK